MQCPIVQERDHNRGNVKMKTFNTLKSCKKESNLDNIVDQLCTRLQNQESASIIGMPTCSLEQTEAVRRYYAAFPALKKGKESPLQYYLPPPAWCRKSDTKVKMQSELSMPKDWNSKNKKYSSSKERRNSYHGQKKNRKRYNSYSRSFECKENLPEWMTHEGVWDMETQDPVKEFIRAIALDEGYGTCENTVTDEIKEITQARFRLHDNMVPDWDDSLDLEADWVITEDLNPRVRSPMEEELYAKFEAKFDRSIEALWSKDQNTPDDEYQDLPIDFQDLLSSPSDHLFADPSAEKCSMISLTESIWSTEATEAPETIVESPNNVAEGLHDRLRPLNIDDPPCPREIESFALYEGEELYEALSSVAKTMRSYTAINHSRDASGFAEVPPRRHRGPPAGPPVPAAGHLAPPAGPPAAEREDLLTAARTHFRPIRREDAEPPRYADGDTFDIRGDLDPAPFRRSDSGGLYLEGSRERYLEYREAHTIDYTRLNLTAAQRCPDLDDPAFRLRFPVRQCDAAAQTAAPAAAAAAWECDECGGSAKKMRPNAIHSIWSSTHACSCGAPAVAAPATGVGGAVLAAAELSREWDELLRDISLAAGAEMSVGVGVGVGVGEAVDRKRRHSAALRFLHCCGAALDRPLTR
ncbi:unnamed protein product, partial [Brenthis ino]